DIAPLCWWSLSGIANIYRPYFLSWGEPESGLISALFDSARGIGYAQPRGDQPLPGTFQQGWDSYVWAFQAMYQHHTKTYIGLVDGAYPSPHELRAGIRGTLVDLRGVPQET
ncbi:MAG TPA: hypothetical protein VKY26_06830, partial [Actinomycetota bacterium]|nr:hypothetical protein [Actinomycetota bacterium]